MEEVEEPQNVSEALSGKYAEKWLNAMKEEINQIQQNKTWSIIKRPRIGNVIGSKWVFKIKHNSAGEIEQFKARLVAQSHKQIEGIDFFDTYSPVIKRKTIRLIMALAVENGWDLRLVDVATAYLNSFLEEDVYMEQPPFSEEKDVVEFVCNLNKSLYGLHQSGRAWNTYLDTQLKRVELQQCVTEPCVHRKKDLLVGLYVDDALMTGTSTAI